VQYAGTYPPFFNPLFHATKTWVVAGTSGAASQYSYVEIMMVLDTSQSMDIGADPSDILTINNNSVCIPAADINDTADIDTYPGPYFPDTATTPTVTNTAQDIAANVNFSNPNSIGNLIKYWNYNTGSCNTTASGYGYTGPYVDGTALAPCALACHTTNVPANGYPGDLYGMARRDGVNLRIDEVFAATENVISTMIATEQAANQYSIGVYQFNDDIAVLAAGTQGNPGNGDVNYEATYNLNTVLQGVRSIDYKVMPTETSFPPIVDAGETVDHTNFPLAMNHFVAGNATVGHPLAAVNVATQGNTPGNPIKDVFIVTDGMEDSSPNVTRSMGEMTSVASETGQTSSAICQKFKNLGYTVYVLYISYYPLPNNFYAQYADGVPATAATGTDYPSFSSAALPQGYAEGGSETNSSLGDASTEIYDGGVPPDEAALEACASAPTDLYVASNSATINSQLSLILKSALSSAIRITQ
jgi:hypothetical protein